jgi:pyruvate/2-oxoacid:ferredoxin oxidoreductase beta subunit
VYFLYRAESCREETERAAGAGYVSRASIYDKGLVEELKEAIAFDGFSLADIWGIYLGRYTRRKKMTPKNIEADLAQLPELGDFKALNARMKYGRAYRQEAARQKTLSDPVRIEATCTPPSDRS